MRFRIRVPSGLLKGGYGIGSLQKVTQAVICNVLFLKLGSGYQGVH